MRPPPADSLPASTSTDPVPTRRGRRRFRVRGGGWLLPDLPDTASPPDGPHPRPTSPSGAVTRLLGSIDPRSAADRCRWLRLRDEADRWDEAWR